MKRFLTGLVLLAICFGAVSCGDSTPPKVELPPDESTPTPPGGDGTSIQPITVKEALDLCGDTPGFESEEMYYIKGTVDEVEDTAFGSMTLSDETGSIYVYGLYGKDGETRYDALEEKPVKGDEVLILGTLANYKGTKEVKKAHLISFTHNAPPFNEADYSAKTVLEARGAQKGDKVKVEGVVARLTYGQKNTPIGFILADDTASIYVYSAAVAGSVQVGNRVTLCGEKTYWILGTEQNNAEKFGYKGCNQIENATMVANDKKTDNPIPLDWAATATMKEIMETSVGEDVSTLIYKVTALVKKVEGTGFTNYYFNDLDGVTGTYAYSQCDGKDFAWVDAFDGKICTVYLAPLNAKSSASGCVWRLQPVMIRDDGYTFDLGDTAKHVVEYYGLGQFLPAYTGDPELELITSVSSSLLGFENAILSYTSHNTDVVTFQEEGDKTVMHCVGVGTALIDIKAAYGDIWHTEQIEIEVKEPETFESITVLEAVNAAKGDEVYVRGIVGPSLVNKVGFYLIDETGVIAVLLPDSAMKTLAIGQDVVIKGTREQHGAKEGKGVGQICLNNCEVAANYFGNHEYSKDSFIAGKDLEYLYALDPMQDHSHQVYTVVCTVEKVVEQYYTSIVLKDDSGTLSLYCKSAGQYQFLEAFIGKQVTMEVAMVNWNEKGYYRGCVLSVTDENGVVYNQLNFTY